jgi:protein TonB
MSSQHTASVSSAAASPVSNGPGELRLLLPEEKTNLKVVFGSGGLSWVAFAALLLLAVWLRPDRQIQAALPDFPLQDIVFIEQAGPGGGGGGGGNKSPDPPKTQPTPAIKPPEPEPVPVPTPEPVPPPPPVIAAEVPAISPVTTVATLSSTTNTAPASLGTGGGGGAGTGNGGGIGPGSGDGLGPTASISRAAASTIPSCCFGPSPVTRLKR